MTSGIRNRATFEALRRRGRRHVAGAVWMRHLAGEESPRVAYAIGASLGPAVTRNRSRRRVSAVLDDLERRGRLPSGAYLVGLRSTIDEQTFDELERSIQACVDGVTS